MPAITKEEVSKIAKIVLKFLDDNKVKSAYDLGDLLAMTFDFADPEGQISIITTPSNYDTEAYKVSYTTKEGIPLEIVMNSDLGYSQVICKGKFMLPGYEPFAADALGNVVQAKKLNSVGIWQVKAELEELAEE